jgi:cobalt-precorrin 5A hydrolase
VRRVIDLKANEQDSWIFAGKRMAIPFIPRRAFRVRGDFTPSDFVESVTGGDNVCERAALTGAKELIVKKTAIGGVTIAIAAENVEVRFG